MCPFFEALSNTARAYPTRRGRLSNVLAGRLSQGDAENVTSPETSAAPRGSLERMEVDCPAMARTFSTKSRA
jgi:hypothetical protein